MTAGRELDAIIAEKVMGGKHVKESVPYTMIDPYTSEEMELFDHRDYWEFPQPDWKGLPLPRFSTSIADAWLVVEKLVGRGRVFIVKGDGLRTGNNPKWTVLCDGVERVDADTAPLAICLAALKAVEGK
jgi:hypothetical protein